MTSSIIPIIIETMMNIRATPMSMKKRRRKTEEEKKETVMKMKNILAKTFLFVVEIILQGLNLDETGKTNIASTMRKCIFKHINDKSQDNETGDRHEYEA